MKYEKKAYEQSLADFELFCGQLNTHLAGRKFLVSDKYSTADTTLGAAFKPRAKIGM